MSIRTYLKAATVALPLAFSGGKALAKDTAKAVSHDANKAVVTDTLQLMNQAATDVKVLIVNVNDNAAKKMVKAPKAQKAPKAVETFKKTADTNLKADVSASIGTANRLNAPAYKLEGTLSKGNNTFTASGLASNASGRTDFVADATYTRSFPMVQDLDATASVGLEGAIHKINYGDSYGQIAPHLTVGAKYNHTFDNGVRVGGKAEIGGAQPFNQRHDTKSFENFQGIVNAEVNAGYKDVTVFANGGHDAIIGSNVNGGVRINF